MPDAAAVGDPSKVVDFNFKDNSYSTVYSSKIIPNSPFTTTNHGYLDAGYIDAQMGLIMMCGKVLKCFTYQLGILLIL